MSTTIEKIKEAERLLVRLREQAQAEEAEKQRILKEKEREEERLRQQREAQHREERKKALPNEIKKAEEEIQKARQALESAQYESRRLRIELEEILNPKPPPPPKERKDYSQCRCTGGNSFYDQEVRICSYCYDYDRR
jgi:DNA repair exonuclease SbcCD ATPase subunit